MGLDARSRIPEIEKRGIAVKFALRATWYELNKVILRQCNGSVIMTASAFGSRDEEKFADLKATVGAALWPKFMQLLVTGEASPDLIAELDRNPALQKAFDEACRRQIAEILHSPPTPRNADVETSTRPGGGAHADWRTRWARPLVRLASAALACSLLLTIYLALSTARLHRDMADLKTQHQRSLLIAKAEMLSKTDVIPGESADIVVKASENSSKELVEGFRRLLQDENADVQILAFGALEKMGAQARTATGDLTEALRDPAKRKYATLALLKIDPASIERAGDENTRKEVFALLTDLTKNENVTVRRSAASTLGNMAPAPGAETERAAQALLAQALRDPSKEVQKTAIQALAKIHSSSTLDELFDTLGDSSKTKDHERVAFVLEYICRARPDEILPRLYETFSSKDKDVRRLTVNLAATYGPDAQEDTKREVANWLVSGFKDADPDVRRSTVSAFGDIGVGSPSTLAVLRVAESSNDKDVRGLASKAIYKVNRNDAKAKEAPR